MSITQDPWSNESTNHQTITCPICGFKLNELGHTNCSICLQSLSRKPVKNQTIKGSFSKNPQKQIAASSRRPSFPDSKRQITKKQPQQKIRRQIIKTIESIAKSNFSHFLGCFINLKTQLISFSQQCKISDHLKRYRPSRKILINPLVALIISLLLSLVLGQTKFFDSEQGQNQNQDRQQLSAELEKRSLTRDTSSKKKSLTSPDSTSRVKRAVKAEFSQSENKPTYSAPRGLFSYGGAFFGSPMFLGNLNQAIESTYTDFKWRHTKAFDKNLSSSTGIKMLIEGNLTVAFSTRPLNDREIERASMRGSILKQTPIAIDALVFFANNNLPISANLTLEQISKIYRGEINNWNQISLKAGNIPIVPIFLNNEDINVLGLKQPSPSVRQVSDYNQLLSQITSTPGAISFSSASLIQEQQPVKIFSLAGSDRPSNYVPALINGQPNLEAFQDGSYPLTRKLFVIYKQDNTFEQNAGEIYVDFLNTKGQKIIEQADLVPLRL